MVIILVDKVDSRPEKIGNVSKEIEFLRKNRKDVLEIKNTIIDMKNAFDGLNNRLYMDEVKKSLGLKISQEKVSKTKEAKNKDRKDKKQNRISKDCRVATKAIVYM